MTDASCDLICRLMPVQKPGAASSSSAKWDGLDDEEEEKSEEIQQEFGQYVIAHEVRTSRKQSIPSLGATQPEFGAFVKACRTTPLRSSNVALAAGRRF